MTAHDTLNGNTQTTSTPEGIMLRTPRRTLGLIAPFALLVGCESGPTELPPEPQYQYFAGSEWSEPVWLGPDINSPQRDLEPALSPDGFSIYFNSERAGGLGGMDLWVSRRECETCPFGPPTNLGPLINSGVNDEAPSISHDGHLLFFDSTRDGGLGGADIYVSWRVDTHDDLGWGPPVNVGPGINSAGHDQEGALLRGGDDLGSTLFFVRNAGRSEIYSATVRIAVREGGDLRVEVEGPALPVAELNHPTANTWSPSVRADGREIVFWSGPQRGGLGGADLWKSTRRSRHDPWSEPTNLGAPVNFAFADLTATLSADGGTLVFASGPQRGGLGLPDLWMSTRTASGR